MYINIDKFIYYLFYTLGSSDLNIDNGDLPVVLNLSRNSLKTIPLHLNSSTSLEEVDLSYNSLSSLDQEAAISRLRAVLARLQRLDLSHNLLSQLDPAALQLPGGAAENSSQLLQLDLSHNQLGSLPAQLFTDLRQLQQLDLSSNPGLGGQLELGDSATSLALASLSSVTSLQVSTDSSPLSLTVMVTSSCGTAA